MGNIVVLDENMTNMIAAGEVIERPASIVKELLENSIDAGAGKITVDIEDGGRKLISICDDGCGMDAADLARAFEPHATSKIKTADDLSRISTMGFRGEALASIASVAQVKATSRIHNSPQANCIEIDCGKKGGVTPASADYGTTIQVRNIFYKLPARRKFLRTANTEMTHIIEHFTRIALAYCDLDMTLVHNSRQIYRLLSRGPLRQRISELLSKPIAEDLIETESKEKGLDIFALLTRPQTARATSKFQYVFLNGRFIRDRFISHAVKEAYRGLIEPNKFPIVFLFLQMPCQAYDVNVHPTKIEVRFDNANLVHSQVLAVLREKLLGMNLDVKAQLPTQRLDRPDQREPAVSEARRHRIASAMHDFFKEHKPIQTSQQHFEFPKSTGSQTIPAGTEQKPYSDVMPSKKFLQLHDTYIVTQTDEGFVIIDQHALHERIIYENLCRKIAAGKLESQRLLIPASFELTDAQVDAIKENTELLEKLGIELAPFGPRTMAVQAFPSMLDKVCPAAFLQDLLDLLTDRNLNLDSQRLLHEALDMASCKAAVKAGQKLTDSEMQQLLTDKEVIERASRCPHGRPTTIQFSLTDLEKQFKRT